MREEFARSALLLGEEAEARLARASVAVFGIGGVGGHAAEAVARAGVGRIALFDADTVSASNINRQIVALHSTLGLPKAQVMADRIRDINPLCRVEPHIVFYGEENAAQFPLGEYDYIIDAVDTVSAKLLLIQRAREAGVPVISAMGCGNKLDPSRCEVADLSRTSVCPLARVMRRELKNRGITRGIPVVYSEVPADTSRKPMEEGRPVIGSISYVPGTAGLYLAGYVIRELINR